jgi:methionyl-tRNA synthetase
MPDGVTVVILPPAPVHRPLPVGDLAGPYLAADLVARAARARGEQVVTTAGFDVHNTSVLTRAEDEGVDAEKLAAAYRDEIVDTLDAARIRSDVLLDPQSDEYRRGVTTLAADLTEAGRAPMRKRTLLACCGARRVDRQCDRCGGKPQPVQAKVPVLSMEDYRQELTEIWLRAELPDHARQLITYHLERRLPDVPIAYPTDWGLAGTGPHEGLRLDGYAEVGLSTMYGVAQSMRPGAIGLEETAQAWSDVGSVWAFDGIERGFYVTLFWPAVYLACGVPPEAIAGAHVNDLSTNWEPANDFLHDKDVELVRLYLAWTDPADITLSSYRQFESWWCRARLNGSTLPRTLAEAEVTRGMSALRPRTFAPTLAVQALLNTQHAPALLATLTGR